MKRLLKSACLLLLCMSMLISSVLPVGAYSAKGTELLEQGKVSEREAIILNIFDYADRIANAKLEDFVKDKTNFSFTAEDRILNEIKKLPDGAAFVEVYSLFKVSAYAFSDLGKALNSWRGQKKASLQSIANYFKDAQVNFWGYAETAYKLGKQYSNTNKPLHDMTDCSGGNLDALAFESLTEAAVKIEKAKDERVFFLSSKSKNQILEWADVLYSLANRTPSMQAFYNLGRYGSFIVPDDAVFIKADTPCMITSKSTGKLLNVYTHSSAKNLKNGVKVNVYKYVEEEADTQTFVFVDNGDGTYGIRVSACQKYIDVYNTKTDRIAKNGAKVQVWGKEAKHWRDQTFKFECENGYYRILLAADTDYCLYVKSNGYLALGKTKAGNSAQLWKIVYSE